MPYPARTPATPATPASGLCWYTNFDKVWPSVPADAFAGAGASHQVLIVIPSLNLIAVRMGDNGLGGEDHRLSNDNRFFWSLLLQFIILSIIFEKSFIYQMYMIK